MARKKIIAGNWKMNMTPSQAVELINTWFFCHGQSDHRSASGILIFSYFGYLKDIRFYYNELIK